MDRNIPLAPRDKAVYPDDRHSEDLRLVRGSTMSPFSSNHIVALVATCGLWWSASCSGPAVQTDDATIRDDATADANRGDAQMRTEGGPQSDGGLDAGSRIDEIVAALSNPSTGMDGAEAIRHDVAWHEGWPLHEGNRWLFVTFWPGHPADVSLVCDCNGWTPGANPAQPSPWDDHMWVLLTDDEVGDPSGRKYKWWAAGPTWYPPPEATAYDYDDFGEVGYVRPPTDRAWLERFPDLTTATLPIPRTIRARLPAGFVRGSPAASTTRILFMHDGQDLFRPDAPWGGWQLGDILEGGWNDVVVLAIDSVSDRMDVYTPVPDDINERQNWIGGRADAYLDLMLDQVLPFFQSRYGLTHDPARLMVAGSSLGGLVSLYQAMTRPDSLACAAGLSSSLGWGAYAATADGSATLTRRWPRERGHGTVALYLDSGGGVTGQCTDVDGDGIFEDSDDEDNYCVTLQFRDILLGLGYQENVDLSYWWQPGVQHNEASWRQRFWRALSACESAGWTAAP